VNLIKREQLDCLPLNELSDGTGLLTCKIPEELIACQEHVVDN
jgi:hypothetical protein